MFDNYLFNLIKVRKNNVQKPVLESNLWKLLHKKGGIDNKWRQYHQNIVFEAAFNINVTAQPPNPKKSYQIIILSRWHLTKQNHETFTKVHEIVWLRHSEYIYQDKVLQIPHSKFPYITFMSWKRLQACPVNSHHRRRTGSRAVSGANSSAGQGNSGECGNNARWWSTSFKRYDAL